MKPPLDGLLGTPLCPGQNENFCYIFGALTSGFTINESEHEAGRKLEETLKNESKTAEYTGKTITNNAKLNTIFFYITSRVPESGARSLISRFAEHEILRHFVFLFRFRERMNECQIRATI